MNTEELTPPNLKKSDLAHLDKHTRYKILLVELQNKQVREYNELIYSDNYTPEKEAELKALHKKRRRAIYKRFLPNQTHNRRKNRNNSSKKEHYS